MFRVPVESIEESDGWVKCGRCRKVFDCRENELDPKEFAEKDLPQQKQSEPEIEAEDLPSSTQGSDDPSPVPQMPLFEESEQASLVTPVTPKTSTTSPAQTQNRTVEKTSTPRKSNDGPDFRSPGRMQKGPARTNVESTLSQGRIKQSVKPVAPKLTSEPQSSMKLDAGAGVRAKQSGSGKKQVTDTRSTVSAKSLGPGLSQLIIAKAQSWKKEKNRFKKSNNLPYWLLVLVLMVLFVWQTAVVNYTRLVSYEFLSGPLSALCSVVKCNTEAAPGRSGFEILHANVRQHRLHPDVVSLTAKLINFSDQDKVLPTIRLDLTDDKNVIQASKLIDLAENPQYVNPAISELAPGQDVKLSFNIDRPVRAVSGFELNLVGSGRE